MNVATNPFFEAVVDRIVDGVGIPHLPVGLQLVGVNRGGIVSDHGVQEIGDLALAVIPSLAEPELSAAFDGAQNGALVLAPVPTGKDAAVDWVAGSAELSADEGFVSLNDTRQHRALG